MTQPDIWTRLAEPFDPSEVKQRQGPGGRMLSYVDARAVAQRLDDVLTPQGWAFSANVIPGTDVVKGRLVVFLERPANGVHNGSMWNELWREDHGYPNSDRDEEPIKAATSDALKRCAVLFGVGRHLYDDNHNGHRTPQHAAPAPPARANGAAGQPPRPAAPTILEEPIEIADSFGMQHGAHPVDDDGTCPRHNKPWRENSRGFYCASKEADGSWCSEKPTQRWISARGAVGAGR